MKRVCMWLIGLYRKYLSPLKPRPTCRFSPTCSAYAYEAFEKRGFLAGFILTIWRILRCSPLSPCGYDPVPETGFRTMPMRWSRYDRYLAENAARNAKEAPEQEPAEHPPEDTLPPEDTSAAPSCDGEQPEQ